MMDQYFKGIQEIEEESEQHHGAVEEQLKRHDLVGDEFWVEMQIRLLESVFHDLYNLI